MSKALAVLVGGVVALVAAGSALAAPRHDGPGDRGAVAQVGYGNPGGAWAGGGSNIVIVQVGGGGAPYAPAGGHRPGHGDWQGPGYYGGQPAPASDDDNSEYDASLYDSSSYYDDSAPDPVSFTGTVSVVGVDSVTLKVKQSGARGSGVGSTTVMVDEFTDISQNDGPLDLADLRPGDILAVTAEPDEHDTSLLTAETIEVQPRPVRLGGVVVKVGLNNLTVKVSRTGSGAAALRGVQVVVAVDDGTDIYFGRNSIDLTDVKPGDLVGIKGEAEGPGLGGITAELIRVSNPPAA